MQATDEAVAREQESGITVRALSAIESFVIECFVICLGNSKS